MIILDPRLSFRINRIVDLRYYKNQSVEIIGECALTGKIMFRFFHPTTGIMEFDEKNEKWVNIVDGITKNYVNEFAKAVLPRYENNIIQYHKIEKKVEDAHEGIKSFTTL